MKWLLSIGLLSLIDDLILLLVILFIGGCSYLNLEKNIYVYNEEGTVSTAYTTTSTVAPDIKLEDVVDATIPLPFP